MSGYNNNTPVDQTSSTVAPGAQVDPTAPDAGTHNNQHNVHHHHPVRDAVAGAGIGVAGGEVKHDWDRHREGKPPQDRHLGRDAALGAAVGGGGAEARNIYNEHHGVTNTTADMEPTASDKIKGTFKKVTGKISGNDAKVIEGEQLKRGTATTDHTTTLN
ncbi:hypothetical protein BC938DRAFT_470989 [Jimgerdemannia flammicorona]|uniref:Uncharacterized protein n=1 Tax=Jimgerdemannia flammicorona TaxID=994334 RepID=A0A433QV47_9FUNG|nr:hypothetical protein BC938DRAFT_470989 [Jimgerdemannia flammicorona]